MPPVIPIEATIITPSELTRLKQGDPTSKQLEAKAKEEPQPEISKKEAEKPKPITAPPPAAEPPPPRRPSQSRRRPRRRPSPRRTRSRKSSRPRRRSRRPSPVRRPTRRRSSRRSSSRSARPRRKRRRPRRRKRQKKKPTKRRRRRKKRKPKRKRRSSPRPSARQQEKKKFDADKIAALLDKTPDKRGAPHSATPPTKPDRLHRPDRRRAAGQRHGAVGARAGSAAVDDQLAAAAVRQDAGRRRRPRHADRQRALPPDQDGSLNGEPVVVDRQNTPLYAIAADASIRAIKQCAPFQLPPDKYASWSTVTWAFDWPVILGLVQR